MPMSIPGPMSAPGAAPAASLAPQLVPPTADTAGQTAAVAGAGAAEGEQRRAPAGKGPDRRLSRADRRTGLDQRQATAEEAGYTGPQRRTDTERRETTGLERRRGPGRRRSDDRKAAEEGEMTGEQFEFVMAIETYKKVNKRMYPTWTEILEVVRQLGYRKVESRKVKLDAPEPELHQR